MYFFPRSTMSINFYELLYLARKFLILCHLLICFTSVTVSSPFKNLFYVVPNPLQPILHVNNFFITLSSWNLRESSNSRTLS